MLPDARVIEPAVHEQARPATRLPQAPRVALFAALRAKLYIEYLLVVPTSANSLWMMPSAPNCEKPWALQRRRLLEGRPRAWHVAHERWHRRADAFGGRDLARGGEKAAERCEVVVDTRWRGTCALVMLRPPHRRTGRLPGVRSEEQRVTRGARVYTL